MLSTPYPPQRLGQGGFDLRSFLDHWPGQFSEADFVEIERVFPLLVDLAMSVGTIYPDFWMTVSYMKRTSNVSHTMLFSSLLIAR